MTNNDKALKELKEEIKELKNLVIEMKQKIDLLDSLGGSNKTYTQTSSIIKDDYNPKIVRTSSITVRFGSYPQSILNERNKNNKDTLNSLNKMAGIIPTIENNNEWIPYNFLDEENNTIMWYKDIFFNGYKYRGVYIRKNRMISNDLSYSFQKTNGFQTDKTYWFKYEPLTWQILNEKDDEITIVTNEIVFSDCFQNNDTEFKTSWEKSNIRKMLNKNFYNDAFDDEEKALILDSKIDNKATTEKDDNEYAINQKNTKDKVYLLSYKDMLNEEYGYANNGLANLSRCKEVTMYAKCMGAYLQAGDEFGYYILRSSSSIDEGKISVVNKDGALGEYMSVGATYAGISPTIKIRLR